MKDAELIGALRSLRAPTPPPVEGLLAHAFPGAPRAPLWSGAALAAASITAAGLPVFLPGSRSAEAWNEGLAKRGVEWSHAVVDHLSNPDR